jgi:hypothetical protein
MAYPSLTAAGRGAGARRTGLLGQVRRLERDIGAKLFRPAPGPNPSSSPSATQTCSPPSNMIKSTSCCNVTATRPRNP